MKGVTLILGAIEGTIYIVFAQSNQILCAQEWYIKTKGTELLTSLLQSTLKKLQCIPQDISRIACIVGPGSFTSLRLILTTAASIRRVLSIPLAPLNYLQILASSISLTTETTIRVLTCACHTTLYMQEFYYDHQKKNTIAITSPKTTTLFDACYTSKPTLFIGSGITQNSLFFSEQALSNPHIILNKQHINISSHTLLQITQNLPDKAWVYNDLKPLYLHECDAVKNQTKTKNKKESLSAI